MELTRQKNNTIPIHKLENNGIGIQMRYFNGDDKSNEVPVEAHRDDHYVFLFQQSGESEMSLDFNSCQISGYSVTFILPGQVHHIIKAGWISGWFMAIDTSLVEQHYRTVFEDLDHHHQQFDPLSEKAVQLQKCAELLLMLVEQKETGTVDQSITHALASVYIGMISRLFCLDEPQKEKNKSRKYTITKEFKRLLADHFKTTKNPVQYADKLCLSLSYLNETIKSVTGFPVSYWIHKEVILEAKRMLYYSNWTVKEIASFLGYEDHAYFSRLFTKVAGTSPVQFRKIYRV